MRVVVDAPPPAKDGGRSIRGEGHPHYRHVVALQKAMTDQVSPEQRLTQTPVSMTMHYERATSKGDALNLINGVADIIQRRGNSTEAPWMIDDDVYVVEFKYTEEHADSDRYTVEITPR